MDKVGFVWHFAAVRRQWPTLTTTTTTKMTTELDMTPTWEFAAQVYCEVLKNPEASAESVRAAEEEILRLARIVDSLKKPQA